MKEESVAVVDRFKACTMKWCEAFREFLEPMLATDREIYLIAVSRKMPRFLKWIQSEFLPGDLRNEFNDLIARCHLTTEIALPFIFLEHRDPAEYEVVVIDDSILLGNTMRRVVDDVVRHAGKKPYVSVVYASEMALAQPIDAEEFLLPTRKLMLQGEMEQWLAFVSSEIRVSSLPVDVEFPVVTIPGFRHQKALDSLATLQGYEIEGDGCLRSINFIVESKLDKTTTSLDFAKLRCFYSGSDDGKEGRVAIFTPYAVPQSVLSDRSFFDDDPLGTAWRMLLDAAGVSEDNQPKDERTLRSLVVMANYLLSVANAVSLRDEIISWSNGALCFDPADIQLLVGRDMAESIAELMAEAFSRGDSRKRLAGRPNLPVRVVSDSIKTTYELMLSVAGMEYLMDNNVEALIEKIFSQSDYIDGIVTSDSPLHLLLSSGIYESFAGLARQLSDYTHISRLEEVSLAERWLRVHKFVDSMIDHGRIVPKYQKVTTPAGTPFWRRFFTSGRAAAEL